LGPGSGSAHQCTDTIFCQQELDIYAIPTLRFNAESGASLNDGKNGGVLAGAAYRVNDRLTIGPGIGVFSEIEDDTSFFPILIVDWKITDTLSLETGRGFAATRGHGLQLNWKYSPRWQFAFGGRYEKTRFRLDDSGPAPGGVGQDKAIPLFALAEFAIAEDMKFSLIGGAETSGHLSLEDGSGRKISSSDLSMLHSSARSFRRNSNTHNVYQSLESFFTAAKCHTSKGV